MRERSQGRRCPRNGNRLNSRHAASAAATAGPGRREGDAKARKARDWPKQIELAIDPAKAERVRKERHGASDDVCSMCGTYCAMKVVEEALGTTGGRCGG